MRQIYCSLIVLIGFQAGRAADVKPGKADQSKIAKLDDTVLALPDSATVLAFDWGHVAAGEARISVLNKSATAISVSAPAIVMSCDPSCAPITMAVSPAQTSIGAYEAAAFALVLPKGAQPDRYAGMFVLRDDGKRTAPLRQPVWIKPLLSKLATTIYRTNPCGRCFSPERKVAVSRCRWPQSQIARSSQGLSRQMEAV